MPRFEPFSALRYATDALGAVVAPPYDVLSSTDLDRLSAQHEHNFVHIDVPRESAGEDRYQRAAETLRNWVADGVMVRDDVPSFTIYRLEFTDATGADRQTVGVLGALEVADYRANRVLPHERVTKKASTDRLDLTRATKANMSPVWGLSLAEGLTSLLIEPGEVIGSVTLDGVKHTVERVTDEQRVQAISALVWSDDVLIADGHHRYGVAQEYRDEVRADAGSDDTDAELTLAFINELVADQLSVEAIHRVYYDIDRADLVSALSQGFEMSDAGPVDASSLAAMNDKQALVLVDAAGNGTWLTPKPDAFDGVRSLDGAWLEHLLADTDATVVYQHGVEEVKQLVAQDSAAAAAVLIRPVSVDEIERTAREGLLMPPKSTFFTPKLLSGLVVRPLDLA